MKDIKEIKIRGKSGEEYVFYDFEDLLKRDLKKPGFRVAYYRELARLNIAKQVEQLRKKKKMSQKQVADKADMTQSVVARLESGTHSVSFETLNRVARALGKEIKLV